MQYYLDRLPVLVEVSLVVLMAWLVAGWLLPAGQQQAVQSQTADSAVIALPELADLVAVPLFGKLVETAVKETPQPVKAQPRPVVQVPLNLKLLGTVLAGHDSVAIVQLNGAAKEKIFFVGDTVQTGAVLKKVEVSAIVIDHNGTLERISMAKASAMAPMHAPSSPMRMASPTSRTMSRMNLQRQMQNLPQLLTQARVYPHMVQGKGDGFVISEIVPGSFYEQVGLRNGDILKKVNGQVIRDAGQAMQMYRRLQKAASVDLEITRAGQLQQLHYDIR